MDAAECQSLKQAILWWMQRNQDAYRGEAMERLGRLSRAERVRQPGPGLHSPLWLLLHVAEIERYYLDVLRGRGRAGGLLTVPSSRPEPGRWPPWEQTMDFVSATREELEARVEKMEPAELEQRFGGHSWQTGAWILAHVFEHESFHMGQLRWALRLVGG